MALGDVTLDRERLLAENRAPDWRLFALVPDLALAEMLASVVRQQKRPGTGPSPSRGPRPRPRRRHYVR
jgi:hypothetical protein